MQLLVSENPLEDFEFVLCQATKTLQFPPPRTTDKDRCDSYCNTWLGDSDVPASVLTSLYVFVP